MCRRIVATVTVVLGVLVLGCVPAFAERIVSSHFVKFNEITVAGMEFDDLGIEQGTGDVFVFEEGDHVIKKFDPEGDQVLAEINGEETPAKEFPAGSGGSIAVDNDPASPSYRDVYVPNSEAKVVYKFEPEDTEGTKYKYVCEFTGPGTGCSPTGGEPSEEWPFAKAITVDSEGNLYVVDTVLGAVYEFDSQGNYLGVLRGPGIAFPTFQPIGIAPGPGGTVYVVNSFNDIVRLTFDSNHKITSETVMDGNSPSGVTVNPLTGLLYTVDHKGVPRISEYEPAGAGAKFIGQFGEGKLGEPEGIAYNTQNGHVYVTNNAAQKVMIFKPGVTPEVSEHDATSIMTTTATLNGEVTQVANSPGETGAWHFEYGPGRSYSTSVPVPSGEVSTTDGTIQVHEGLTGLNPGMLYHARLIAENEGGFESEDITFTTPPAVPPNSTFASNVTSTGVILHGEIEPGTDSIPNYHFAYGQTTAYGCNTPETVTSVGNGADTVEQQIVSDHEPSGCGLLPGTTYHFALIATNAGGAITTGPDETFIARPSTPPTLSTGVPGSVGETTGSVGGTLNPQGLATSYHIEYGTSTSYGQSWPIAGGADAGQGLTDQSVTITLENLTPGTLYHYRLAATNEDGTAYGSDQTLTTIPYPTSNIPTTPVLTTNLGFINPETAGKPQTKRLTRAQQLTKALKACKTKPRSQRATCEKRARKKYGTTTRKTHKRK